MTDPTAVTPTDADSGKAWYESKTIWGALITAASLIGGIVFHKTISAGDQQALVDIITSTIGAAATVLTIWGRVTANGPLGSSN